MEDKLMSNTRPIPNSRFSNAPRMPQTDAKVEVKLADLAAMLNPPPQPRYDDGYRRYLKCDECQSTAKIFTCFTGDKAHCGEFALTHTHVDCECGKKRFSGAVRFRSKEDQTPVVTATVTK